MNKTTISKQIFEHGDQKLEYTLVRSKRRKTSELIVDENEIMLRIPFDKSINDTQKLLGSKIRWIIRKQREYREQIPEIIKTTFTEGSTLPYLGKNCEIQIVKDRNNDDDKIELVNNKFLVILGFQKYTDNQYNSRIKSLYEDWLADRSKEVFKNKVVEFSKILKVTPKKIIVKKLKKRWGSVSKNETINLNLNLMKAQEDVVDYVIIHELCHLIIKKHSHHYWNLLKKYESDYKRKIEWLEINGKNMIDS